jgi:RNA polymerase sigma factor (TIGR02999 family)
MTNTPDPSQITQWLTEWRQGDGEAGDRLFSAMYPHLCHIAARFLRQERADHTLEPSALVNELASRLLSSTPITYTDRAHFLALSAKMMRHILIDHARGRNAGKRGGVQQRINLSSIDDWLPTVDAGHVVLLDEALSRLERADARAARVVELRFFGGLREDEVAEALGVSVITVKRDWKFARAWLIDQLPRR